MEEKRLNHLSLMPRSKRLRQGICQRSKNNLSTLIIISIVLCLASLVTHLIEILVGYYREESLFKYNVYAASDVGRIAYYLVILVVGRKHTAFQYYAAYPIPLVYSVIVCETYIVTGLNGHGIARVLSAVALNLLYALYIPFSFGVAAVPVLLSSIYPFVRLMYYSANTMLLILNVFFGELFCIYTMRRLYISDVCGFFIKEKINEQWKEVIGSLSSGKAIMSGEKMDQLVYYNPAMEELAQKINSASFDSQLVDKSIEETLKAAKVKIVARSGEGVAHSESFIEFLERFGDDHNNGAHESYFLDQSDALIELRVNKVTFEGKKAKIVSFIDCSSAQRLEKAQTESKYKTSLIATISHELRTPINAVLGTLEMIRQYVPEDAMKYMEIAKESCNMITFHINDLTDYGKLTGSNVQIVLQTHALTSVIEPCINLVKYTAEQKGLKVECCPHPSAPQKLIVDERRLKQVIINLLSNAIKFTPQGTISIIAKGKVKENHQRVLIISIKDTGMGIKDSDIPKLFTEFGTLPTHQSINPNGTGLGLYLSRKLIRLMNGDITVKSTYGVGSKFIIQLPLADIPECSNTPTTCKLASLDSPSPPIDLHIISPRPLSILVVDDNAMNALVVLSLLKKMGATCDKAVNGQQAICMVKEKAADSHTAYSLIFMDINMPVMCGDEATCRLRGMMEAGEVPYTPIVALSGEDQEKILGVGFDASLQTPITCEKLKETVEKFACKEAVSLSSNNNS